MESPIKSMPEGWIGASLSQSFATVRGGGVVILSVGSWESLVNFAVSDWEMWKNVFERLTD
jgi:hypothetical protein